MTPNPKIFEEMFEELSDFDPEKLTSLISEATSVLKTVVEKAKSPNPEDKAQATQTVTELKNSIEKQVSSLFESMGIDKTELEAFMSDPTNFSPDEQNLIDRITKELEQFKPEGIKNPEPKRVINKKKRSTWLPG
jgi:hypothetical protein